MSSVLALASASLTVAGNGVAGAAPAPGHVVVVQAVPGAEVAVSIDGKPVEQKADVGSLSEPVQLSAGTHDLVFTGVPGAGKVMTRLNVKPGSNTDVVLHKPASVKGAPVVSTYQTPLSPIGPEKARVLLAHTATVAPADVRVDGKVVFTNIANGEYADADLPAGAHRVALLPTGIKTNPLLGPLTLTLRPRTATMVYAVGSPSNGSMDAIVHEVPVRADGSAVPRSINTGSAGRAARAQVVAFDEAATTSGRGSEDRAGPQLPWFGFGVAGLVLVGLALWRRPGTSTVPARRPPPPRARRP